MEWSLHCDVHRIRESFTWRLYPSVQVTTESTNFANVSPRVSVDMLVVVERWPMSGLWCNADWSGAKATGECACQDTPPTSWKDPSSL